MRFLPFFYEANERNLAEIKDHIKDKDSRPFKDLFGDKERFLVKVYNPDFSKAMKSLDMKMDDYDWKHRTYKGKPISSLIRTEVERLKKRIPSKAESVAEFKNIHSDTLKGIQDKILDMNPTVEDWVDNKLNIKSESRMDMGLFDPKYIQGISRSNWTAKDADIYMNAVLFGKELGNATWGEVDRWVYGVEQLRKTTAIVEKITIKKLGEIKQCINQNNIFYYLLFTRHPIDVLRMSDHKGISSCHRLNGGDYAYCAISDAKNSGGVVYLIKGSDGKRVAEKLQDQEVFADQDRDVGGIVPIGRTRIRCFVDTKTGEDFAVLARYTKEQHYGVFTEDIYNVALNYTRKNQSIFNNKPDPDYACKYIVMAGGDYTDNATPSGLMNRFFQTDDYDDCIKFRDSDNEDGDGVNDYIEEMRGICATWNGRFNPLGAVIDHGFVGDGIDVYIRYTRQIGWDEVSDRLHLIKQGSNKDINVDRDLFDKFIEDNRKVFEDQIEDLIPSWYLEDFSIDIESYNTVVVRIIFKDTYDDPYGAQIALGYIDSRKDIQKMQKYVDDTVAKFLGDNVDLYITEE